MSLSAKVQIFLFSNLGAFLLKLSIITLFMYTKYSKTHYSAWNGVLFKSRAVFKGKQYCTKSVYKGLVVVKKGQNSVYVVIEWPPVWAGPDNVFCHMRKLSNSSKIPIETIFNPQVFFLTSRNSKLFLKHKFTNLQHSIIWRIVIVIFTTPVFYRIN